MEQSKRNEYFWQQYHGTIKAVDLPKEYIEYDTRVYCCNEECFGMVRDKCELFNRYAGFCHVFGRKVMRGCLADAKGSKLPNGVITYMNASFGFAGEQHGAKPCKYFIDKGKEQ